MDVGNVDGIRAQGSLDSDVHTVSPYRLCWVEVSANEATGAGTGMLGGGPPFSAWRR